MRTRTARPRAAAPAIYNHIGRTTAEEITPHAHLRSASPLSSPLSLSQLILSGMIESTVPSTGLAHNIVCPKQLEEFRMLIAVGTVLVRLSRVSVV